MTLLYKKEMPLAILSKRPTDVYAAALERHVQRAKMHKRAEDDGKQHGVNQSVYETVVEFDKAPRGVQHKYDDRGDKDWL
jgi:hypothetical protein